MVSAGSVIACGKGVCTILITAGALFCGGHTPLCTITRYCSGVVSPAATSYTLSASTGLKSVHATPSGEDCQLTGNPTSPVSLSKASLVCPRQNCISAGDNTPPTVRGSTTTVVPVLVSMLQDSPSCTSARKIVVDVRFWAV